MSKEKKVKDVLAPRSSKVTKSTSKSKRKPEPKVAFKSSERITASDDENMDVTSDVPAGTSKPASAVKTESSDDDDESDESGLSDSDVGTSATSKAIPKQKERLASHNATENEDGDKYRGATSTPIATPAKKGQGSTSKTTTSSTSSTAAPMSNGRIDTEISEKSLRPTRRYEPPSAFKSVKDETIAEAVDMFRARNTMDKEIWYISAPASLPITALKEVALEKFAKQQAIMSHEGEHYALVSDPAAVHSTRVLLPQHKSGYKALSTPVKHVLQFQQVLNVQATSSKGRPKTVAQVLLDTDVPTKPSKRPQPVGLRMKWRPSGFGDGYLGAIGSSDEEEELPEASTLHAPRNVAESTAAQHDSQKKKRKKEKHSSHGIVTAQEATEAKAVYVQEATTAIDADQKTAPPEAQAPEGKKKKKHDKKGVEIATGPEPTAEPQNGESIEVEGEAENDFSERKKEKKKKKRKHGHDGAEAEAEARAINGSEQLTIDLEEASDKKKKKKKKNKDKDAMEM